MSCCFDALLFLLGEHSLVSLRSAQSLKATANQSPPVQGQRSPGTFKDDVLWIHSTYPFVKDLLGIFMHTKLLNY